MDTVLKRSNQSERADVSMAYTVLSTPDPPACGRQGGVGEKENQVFYGPIQDENPCRGRCL
jgi:hypothetical protein